MSFKSPPRQSRVAVGSQLGLFFGTTAKSAYQEFHHPDIEVQIGETGFEHARQATFEEACWLSLTWIYLWKDYVESTLPELGYWPV